MALETQRWKHGEVSHEEGRAERRVKRKGEIKVEREKRDNINMELIGIFLHKKQEVEKKLCDHFIMFTNWSKQKKAKKNKAEWTKKIFHLPTTVGELKK